MDRPGLTDARAHTLRIEVSLRSMVTLVAVVGGVWLLVVLWPVLLMVVSALILVGTLGPVVDALCARGLGRKTALGLVVGGLLAAPALLAVVTVPSLVRQATQLAGALPAAEARAADWLGRSRLTASLAAQLRRGAPGHVGELVGRQALSFSSRAVEVVAVVVTTLVLAIYVLADRERMRGGAYALVPRRYHLRLARVLLNMETIVGGYMRGQVITSAAMAVATLVVLLVFRVPSPLPLAVFAAVCDVVPFVGGFVALVPAGVAALQRGPGAALAVVGLIIAYEEFESRLLVPWVYGRALRLPSAAVVVALLVGAQLLGILGALLALPIAAGLRMVVEELRLELPGEETLDEGLRERDAHAEEVFAERAAGAPAEQAAAIAVEIADEIRRADAPDPAEAAQVPITDGR